LGKEICSREVGYRGPTYVVECNYCGKKFKRKTNNTILKAHKDKTGLPLFGKAWVFNRHTLSG